MSKSDAPRRWKRKAKVAALGVGLVLVIVGGLAVSRYTIVPEESPLLAGFQRQLGINYAATRREAAFCGRVIGHRGAGPEQHPRRWGSKSLRYPENTKGAIQHAVDHGIRTIEVDVMRTRDGELILFHDKTIGERLLYDETGAIGEEVKVSELDFAEIQGLSWKEEIDGRANSFEEERDELSDLLTLDQLFRFFPKSKDRGSDLHWVLDLKQPGLEKELLPLLEKAEDGGDIVGNQITLMGEYQRILPFKESGYELVYVASWSEGWKKVRDLNKVRFLLGDGFIVERCRNLGSHLEAVTLPATFVNESLIRDLKAIRSNEQDSEIEVWSYLGEEPETWYRLVDLGVDGLIVDDVKAAREEFPEAD